MLRMMRDQTLPGKYGKQVDVLCLCVPAVCCAQLCILSATGQHVAAGQPEG